MAGKNIDPKSPAQQVKVPVNFTEEEVEYREDLQQKLLTLEHAKGLLIARDDSPVFIHQIQSLHDIVQQWYVNAVMAKRGVQNERSGNDGKGKGDEKPGDADPTDDASDE
jgi:hypothetical protein